MTPSVLLVFLIVPFAVLATVLGWVAVAQIRRSGGRRTGLWLALLDGLLFPLLGLYAFMVWFTRAFAATVLGWPWNDPMQGPLCFVAASLLFAAAAFFIVRGTWRMADIPALPSPPSTVGKVALGCGVAALILVLLHIAMVALVFRWNQKRQAEVAMASRQMMRLQEQKIADARAAYEGTFARFRPTQTVVADRSGRGGIDLDAGRFVPFDPQVAGAPAIELAHRWLQAEGVDVFADPTSFRPGLLFTAVAPSLMEVGAASWDADPGELLRSLPPPPPPGVYTDHMTFVEPPQGTGHPKTYLIRTQQGGAAILQILEVTDSQAVKFRYKSILPGK